MKLKSFSVALVCLIAVISISNPIAANDSKEVVLSKSQKLTGQKNSPVSPVKNVILLIPDGCSLSTISAARWYQWLKDNEKPSLYIDPYISGTVRTFSSDAPIGDSAPTTSCYMTGEPSKTGFVSTYPTSSGLNNILYVDSTKAYQPLMTVMEAARIIYGKSLGLVFTSEFPHATPADCSSHSYNRNDYTSIASQMVHNKLDVVIGGGVSILEENHKSYLRSNGYEVITNDINAMRMSEGKKLWSLFESKSLPYDIDRDPSKTPSLQEMTEKAISVLSKNKKGFFLMVEGSKIDWAAHANDPVGMITDFLAFDKACKAAIDFAKKDGNTAVIILPDHGNSGFSIGVRHMTGYDKLTKDQIFGNSLKFKKTAEGIAKEIKESDKSKAGEIFRKYTSIELNDSQLLKIDSAMSYPKYQSLDYVLAKFMTDNTGFGFSTNGHTGEEVFLASYHPKNKGLKGVLFNFQINDYLCGLMKLDNRLPELTEKFFAKHSDVFKGMDYSIEKGKDKDHPVLKVVKNGKVMLLTDDSSIIEVDGILYDLATVVVYVDKNNTFYLPRNIVNYFN